MKQDSVEAVEEASRKCERVTLSGAGPQNRLLEEGWSLLQYLDPSPRQCFKNLAARIALLLLLLGSQQPCIFLVFLEIT